MCRLLEYMAIKKRIIPLNKTANLHKTRCVLSLCRTRPFAYSLLLCVSVCVCAERVIHGACTMRMSVLVCLCVCTVYNSCNNLSFFPIWLSDFGLSRCFFLLILAIFIRISSMETVNETSTVYVAMSSVAISDGPSIEQLVHSILSRRSLWWLCTYSILYALAV